MGRERSRWRNAAGYFSSGKRGCFTGIAWVCVILIMGGSFFVSCFEEHVAPLTMSGPPIYQEAMLKTVRRCPRAKRALGSEIEFGWGRGTRDYEYNAESKNGYANFDLPIQGSKADGRLVYKSTVVQGKTRLGKAMLTVDGEQINLKRCGSKKGKSVTKSKKRRTKANRRTKGKKGKRKRR